MKISRSFDLSAYLVIGPENTRGRQVADIVRSAVQNGFSFVQLRAKNTEAREQIALASAIAGSLSELEQQNKVTFVINDRLDVVLAAREQGIKVDGIHIGQQDIPPHICRKYLGDGAIIGLSAPTQDLLNYVREADLPDIDYLGAGPLHQTSTKSDCGRLADGTVVTRSLEELTALAELSPWPVTVGGGVKLEDLPNLAKTGVAGFFVVSAVAEAANPGLAAKELTDCWKQFSVK